MKQRPSSDVYNSLVVESTTKRSTSSKRAHSNISSNHYRSVTDAAQLVQKKNSYSLFKIPDEPRIIKDNFMVAQPIKARKTRETRDKKAEASKISVQKK